MVKKHRWMFLLLFALVALLGMGLMLTACSSGDDDDDSGDDDSGDDDTTDDDTDDDTGDDDTANDCEDQFLDDLQTCANEYATDLKNFALCMMDAYENLMNCLHSAGLLDDESYNCINDCIDDARTCINGCGDDNCIDNCMQAFSTCVGECGFTPPQ